MVDTVRSLNSLQTILADNSTGDIGSQDLRDFLVSVYLDESQANLENGKTSSDTPDDEFDSGTLDGKWTVTSGSEDTVDITRSTASSAIYDISTRSEDLLSQASNANFSMRQDYTLPDGNSIILALTPNLSFDLNVADNEALIELALNDNDSSPNSGSNRVVVMLDAGASTYQIIGISQTGITVASNNKVSVGQKMYYRIARVGLTYYMYYSLDGNTWTPLGSSSPSSAPNNIWIGVRSNVQTPSPKAIVSFHWIRQGSNNLDPW